MSHIYFLIWYTLALEKSFKIEYHPLNPAPENMYMYEGEDYSKASDSDKKTFDQLLAGEYI